MTTSPRLRGKGQIHTALTDLDVFTTQYPGLPVHNRQLQNTDRLTSNTQFAASAKCWYFMPNVRISIGYAERLFQNAEDTTGWPWHQKWGLNFYWKLENQRPERGYKAGSRIVRLLYGPLNSIIVCTLIILNYNMHRPKCEGINPRGIIFSVKKVGADTHTPANPD